MPVETKQQNGFLTLSEYVAKWWSGISKPGKTALFTAFIAGFIVHIASITGLNVNWDSLVSLKNDGFPDMLQQGKWFTPILVQLRGIVQMGSLDGILALFWLSVACVMLVRILRIQSCLYAGLMSLIIVTMPSVMCASVYPAEDIFIFAFFLSVLAVYCVLFVKRGYLWGTVSLVFSLGTYQAYIGFTAGLFVLVCLMSALQNQKPIRFTLLTGLKYIAVLAVGVLLYYGILKLILAITHLPLSNYRGIDKMEAFNLAGLPSLVYSAYKVLAGFMLVDYWGFGWNSILPGSNASALLSQIQLNRCAVAYPLIVIITVVLLIWSCIRHGLFKKGNRWNLLLVLCLTALFPLAVSAIAILGQNAYTHWIMKYPFVLLFVFPVLLMDELETDLQNMRFNLKRKPHKAAMFLQIASVAICGFTVFNWFLITNQAYTAVRVSYEGAYYACTRIADDLYADEDYDPAGPLCVIGKPEWDDGDVFSEFNGRYTGIEDRNFIFLYRENSAVPYMLKNYLGVPFVDVAYEDAESIKATAEFQAMPSYPKDGYIQRIEGITVVKTGPNP